MGKQQSRSGHGGRDRGSRRSFSPRGRPRPRHGGGKGGPRRGKGGPRRGGGKFHKKRTRPDRALVAVESLKRGPGSRYQALTILVEADESGKFVDQILEGRIRSGAVGAEDKHLVQEIVFGAIRHRNTLDQVLDAYLHFSMTRQHVAVRWALRLATYQLVYLSRVPSHAAIHGTVEAIKAIKGMEARDAGFVNAVLRRMHGDIEEKTEEPPLDPTDPRVIPSRHGWCRFKRAVLPSPSANRTMFLALKYSHPRWLMSRWISRFGEEETTQLCIANNRVPLVTAMLTARAPSREEVVASLEAAEVEVEPGVLPDALRLRRTGDVRELEAYREGWIRIQDETAAAIGAALAPAPGTRVLDLCAAPGGKAAQLLEAVGEKGHVVACDIDSDRIERIRESLERVGDPASFTVIKVPENPAELPRDEVFPAILVDVPCSNTGVLARRPEARWRVHSEDLPKLAARQVALLDAGLRRLAPGGRLVYATCSIEPEENGQVVATLRSRYPGLEEEASRLFLPHRDGADGGYYAILVAPETDWPPGV